MLEQHTTRCIRMVSPDFKSFMSLSQTVYNVKGRTTEYDGYYYILVDVSKVKYLMETLFEMSYQFEYLV